MDEEQLKYVKQRTKSLKNNYQRGKRLSVMVLQTDSKKSESKGRERDLSKFVVSVRGEDRRRASIAASSSGSWLGEPNSGTLQMAKRKSVESSFSTPQRSNNKRASIPASSNTPSSNKPSTKKAKGKLVINVNKQLEELKQSKQKQEQQ